MLRTSWLQRSQRSLKTCLLVFMWFHLWEVISKSLRLNDSRVFSLWSTCLSWIPMAVVKVKSVVKSNYEQSPLGIISTNECWLNVGPVLVKYWPSTQPEHGGQGSFKLLCMVMGLHLDVDFTLLFTVGLDMLINTMHLSGTALLYSRIESQGHYSLSNVVLVGKKSSHFINI